MNSEIPTNPEIPKITVEEQLDYILGTVRSIQCQLASDEPPPWAKKMLGDLTLKIKNLEEEINKINIICAARHGNGLGNKQLKLPLI